MRSVGVETAHLLAGEPTFIPCQLGEIPMYEMYPEWGPARHDPQSPTSHQAVQAALDLRDNGGERPDDN